MESGCRRNSGQQPADERLREVFGKTGADKGRATREGATLEILGQYTVDAALYVDMDGVSVWVR
jgi:hypothetical protein